MMPQMTQQNPQMVMRMRQQMINNPQQFAQNALRSGYFNNSPMHIRALEAVANNRESVMNEMVGNICKEHNVSVDDAMAQYRKYYGINQSNK